MFMQIAIGAIGIGVVLMVGYLVIAKVKTALPTPQTTYTNACFNQSLGSTTYCNTTGVTCGPLTDNTSLTVTCDDVAYTTATANVQTTIYAGFALIAVGIIVLAAFGLISVFK
jgi:hypothetical protein